MLLIGERVEQENGLVAYDKGFSGEGMIFKDEEAFLHYPDRVCYIPELEDEDEEDSMYTRQDFLDLCNGQEELAADCFYCLTWQDPSTWVEEAFLSDEWAKCPKCGKIYVKDENNLCPYCSIDREEFRAWIYENYNVPGNACTPNMLDGILDYATGMPPKEQHRFLCSMFPSLPEEVICQTKF